MSITASSLYRDTIHFFRYQIYNIIFMALFISVVTIIISQILTLDQEYLISLKQANDSAHSLFEFIQKLSPAQYVILLRASAMGTFAALIGNTLLLGGMIYLIISASQGEQVSSFSAITLSIPLLPKLLLQTFLITLIVQLGFMILIFPGIILITLLSLAPIILKNQNISVIDSLYASISLVSDNIKLIMPAILMWLLMKIIIIIIFFFLIGIPVIISLILLNMLSNLAYAILIIYLYRLYMLLH
ncbi:YciC family protein [Pantoea sp. Aalb]|uniref:YciC family protein n=1 Tax=Pantoea sp. Aalb TaxID=2576762 RepID=UPI001328C47A|nr:YciC family protein [Pantoea sp. Aalb]MXP67388.1 UPF0259 family protein [Pantoea sp. Aalb]